MVITDAVIADAVITDVVITDDGVSIPHCWTGGPPAVAPHAGIAAMAITDVLISHYGFSHRG
jgi:hypothetical protein